MSVIECKSCGGRFRVAAKPEHKKPACPKCGVPLKTESSPRFTTRSQATENVTSEGGLRLSGIVTKKPAPRRSVMVATVCVLAVLIAGAFMALHG